VNEVLSMTGVPLNEHCAPVVNAEEPIVAPPPLPVH